MSTHALQKRGARLAIGGVAAAAGALALASLLLPSAASPRAAIGTFPPGFWCGIGKAPAGLKLKIGPVVVEVENGVMKFDLNSSKGSSYGSWGAVIATNGFTTPHYKAEGRFALDGDGDVIGTTVHPKTDGTWHITGKIFVKGSKGKKIEVPFTQHIKKWQTELVIESSSLDRVRGHWLVPQWKWAAHRLKSLKGCTYTA